MDDANLSKISVSHKGLKPDFHKDTVAYEIDVPCSLDKLQVKATTSDTGASFVVKNSTTNTFGADVKLNDGDNNIIIEVTSEDGTMKKYLIKCKRLSASDANLRSFKLFTQNLEIKPSFNSTQLEYLVLADYKVAEVKFSIEILDPACGIEVLSEKTPLTKNDADSTYKLTLNFGFTNLIVKVTSPDKTKTQEYAFELLRGSIPRLCSFLKISEQIDFTDMISLGPVYAACRLDKTQTTDFSYLFADYFFRTAQPDKLSIISLNSEYVDNLEASYKTEKNASSTVIRIPYLNGEFSKEITLKNASSLIEEINEVDAIKQSTDEEIKNFNPVKVNKIPDSLPVYQPRSWEKHMQIVYDETDGDKLVRLSQSSLEKYLATILTVNSVKQMKVDNNESAFYYLNMSIFNLATSLKFKSKDYQTHFKLAALLEEKSFLESLYGAERKEEELIPTLSLQNNAAAESSKEEEIDAIAKSRNVNAGASDVEKLKALDQEYHYLMESGQSVKAEQIQLLYQFKAKKMNSSQKSNIRHNESGDCLIQANLKYQDGLALILESRQTNFHAYLTIGRSFCQIEDFQQASIYLKPCINWSDAQLQPLARFYFAFALSKQKELCDLHSKQIFFYLLNGLQQFLLNISKTFSNRKLLISEDNYSIFNTMMLEGFLVLGRLKKEYQIKIDSISSENSFRYCAWLCCIALVELDKRTTFDPEQARSSRLVKEIVRILIDAHSSLINTIKVDPKMLNDSRTLKAKHCVNLINILRSATNRDDREMLKLQENVARTLVFADPLDTYHLVLLSCAKLELYDSLAEISKSSDDVYLKELLEDTKNLLAASAESLANTSNDKVSNLILDQKWWKKLEAEEQELLAPKPASGTRKAAPSKPTPGPKTSQAQASMVQMSQKKNSTPIFSDPKASKASVASLPTKTSTSKPVSAPVIEGETKYVRKDCGFNRKLIGNLIQLYSARVHSKMKEFEKAKGFYEQVIKSEPRYYDAYAEMANMLKANGDIMGAIDIYAKYPTVGEKREGNVSSGFLKRIYRNNSPSKKKSESLSFDDAFIYGEIVTLLINNKNYDDSRLATYLILWAQVMGIAIIEKYITILDKANKTQVCKQVYASVNKKNVDDPDLVQFFKFKGWL